MQMTFRQQICGMAATELVEANRTKQLSPVEVVDAHLEQMEILEPSIHAFCTVTTEAARKREQEVEARILRGEKVGALAGVPVGNEDLVCTAGIMTTSGSAAYQKFIPDEDDVVVERLKEADAIIVGKTNVPEFGYSGVGHNPIFETTRNPWNLDLTPGGSSAGSGAVVPSGKVPFAIGSDGDGSIRIPAAHSGSYGIKASMGRVPLYPGCRDERYPGVSSWESPEHWPDESHGSRQRADAIRSTSPGNLQPPCRRVSPMTDCPLDYRLSDVICTIHWSCVPRRPSSRPGPGESAGRNCLPRPVSRSESVKWECGRANGVFGRHMGVPQRRNETGPSRPQSCKEEINE
jgi:hypothetical protein